MKTSGEPVSLSSEYCIPGRRRRQHGKQRQQLQTWIVLELVALFALMLLLQHPPLVNCDFVITALLAVPAVEPAKWKFDEVPKAGGLADGGSSRLIDLTFIQQQRQNIRQKRQLQAKGYRPHRRHYDDPKIQQQSSGGFIFHNNDDDDNEFTRILRTSQTRVDDDSRDGESVSSNRNLYSHRNERNLITIDKKKKAKKKKKKKNLCVVKESIMVDGVALYNQSSPSPPASRTLSDSGGPLTSENQTEITQIIYDENVQDDGYLRLPILLRRLGTTDSSSSTRNKTTHSSVQVSNGAADHDKKQKPVPPPTKHAEPHRTTPSSGNDTKSNHTKAVKVEFEIQFRPPDSSLENTWLSPYPYCNDEELVVDNPEDGEDDSDGGTWEFSDDSYTDDGLPASFLDCDALSKGKAPTSGYSYEELLAEMTLQVRVDDIDHVDGVTVDDDLGVSNRLQLYLQSHVAPSMAGCRFIDSGDKEQNDPSQEPVQLLPPLILRKSNTTIRNILFHVTHNATGSEGSSSRGCIGTNMTNQTVCVEIDMVVEMYYTSDTNNNASRSQGLQKYLYDSLVEHCPDFISSVEGIVDANSSKQCRDIVVTLLRRRDHIDNGIIVTPAPGDPSPTQAPDDSVLGKTIHPIAGGTDDLATDQTHESNTKYPTIVDVSVDDGNDTDKPDSGEGSGSSNGEDAGTANPSDESTAEVGSGSGGDKESTGTGDVGGNDKDEDGKTSSIESSNEAPSGVTGGQKAGFILAAFLLALIIVVLLSVGRRRAIESNAAMTNVRHMKLIDDDDIDVDAFLGLHYKDVEVATNSSESNSSPKRRNDVDVGVNDVGEGDGDCNGHNPDTDENGTLGPLPPLFARNADVHRCSSATCTICNTIPRKRIPPLPVTTSTGSSDNGTGTGTGKTSSVNVGGGIHFIPILASLKLPVNPSPVPQLPTSRDDDDRDYSASDTVSL